VLELGNGDAVWSESFELLSDGLQNAFWELRGTPRRQRSDSRSAAVSRAIRACGTHGDVLPAQQKERASRGSHGRSNGLGTLHVVSAWATQRGISLGQVAVDGKSNEITAIPQLLDHIDLTNAVITIDAAGCQKNIAKKIIDGGGQYVLALKGNQENLYQAVERYFEELQQRNLEGVAVSRFEEQGRAQGRDEER
jgi:predicted transposase YbfD/YdcC